MFFEDFREYFARFFRYFFGIREDLADTDSYYLIAIFRLDIYVF